MNAPASSTGRYARRFAQLAAEGRGAFIPFTLLGWPSMAQSRELIAALIAGGADALELGLPFSDPMADGPLLQQAAQEALASGATVSDAFALIAQARERDADLPIGLMAYYNMILARGRETFCQDAARAGVDALLVADLPPETADELLPIARAHGLELAFIASPLTRGARLEALLARAGGFLYVVSRLGVTGVEARYDEELADLLRRLKAQSTLPACVGFGISQPAHVAQMMALGADGAIAGSAVIQQARAAIDAVTAGGAERWTDAVMDYVRAMRAATVKTG